MFGIGISELILIAVVALVVVGPKNLPLTLRAVGRAIREFQRASRELREQAGFDEVVDEVTRPLREGLAGIEHDVLHEREDTSMEYPEAGPDDFGALSEGASWYPDELSAAEANPEAPAAEGAPVRAVVEAPAVADAPAVGDAPGVLEAPAVTVAQTEERGHG
jgi:sec-independent protein translocase protein TatB